MLLRYTVPGEDDENTLRLYDRKRALTIEASEEELKDHICEVLRTRQYLEEWRRKEEEEARLAAEAEAAAQEERRQKQERLAQQRVVRIDDRFE